MKTSLTASALAELNLAMMDYRALAALAAVLRSGSFEGAAARLGVTPSAVSQRVRGLEERVGAVLVQRGVPARATPAGERLLRHADDVAALERALSADLPEVPAERPTLRIAVNADSLATWFLPALAGLDMLFEIEIDDQDYSDLWLRRGAVAAAVTARADPVQGCDCRPLGALPYRAVASPAFRDRWFAAGMTADALRQAPSLRYDSRDRLQADWAEAECGRAVDLPAHRLASSEGFRQAALLGLGWGMAPLPLVAPDLREGRLVALSPRGIETPLHWQVSRLSARALAPLTAAVRAAARAMAGNVLSG